MRAVQHYLRQKWLLLSLIIAITGENCVGLPLMGHNPNVLPEKTSEISIASSVNYASNTGRRSYYYQDVPDENGLVNYRDPVQYQDWFVSYSRGVGKNVEVSGHIYAIFQNTSSFSGIPWFGGSAKWQFWDSFLQGSLFIDVSLPVPWCLGGATTGACGMSYGFNPGISLGKDYLYLGISYAIAQMATAHQYIPIHMPVLILGSKLGGPFTVNAEISSFRNNFYDLQYSRENTLIPITNDAFGFQSIVFSIRLGYKMGTN